jgi:hypothetical protein
MSDRDFFECPKSFPQFKPHFSWALELHELSMDIRRFLSDCDVKGDPEFVCSFGGLYHNSIGGFSSVSKLCQHGHAYDGLRIGRSLVENEISMRYILTDRKKLSLQFLNHGLFSHLNYKEAGRRVSSTKGYRDGLEESIRKWKDFWFEELEEFLSDKTKWRKNWTGMPLGQLAADESIWGEDSRVRDLYNTRFRDFSMYTHTCSFTLLRFVRSDFSGFKEYSSSDNVDVCLKLVGGVFLETNELVCKTFGIHFDERIEQLRADEKELSFDIIL